MAPGLLLAVAGRQKPALAMLQRASSTTLAASMLEGLAASRHPAAEPAWLASRQRKLCSHFLCPSSSLRLAPRHKRCSTSAPPAPHPSPQGRPMLIAWGLCRVGKKLKDEKLPPMPQKLSRLAGAIPPWLPASGPCRLIASCRHHALPLEGAASDTH